MKTPEGYVLVPVEPTPEMIEAGIDHNNIFHDDEDGTVIFARRVYAAMLSAAPRDKALVEEGGLREALDGIEALAEIALNGASLGKSQSAGQKLARRIPALMAALKTTYCNACRQSVLGPCGLSNCALSALSTKDMGLSRDLSQTADAATPKSAAPEQVKP